MISKACIHGTAKNKTKPNNMLIALETQEIKLWGERVKNGTA